MPRKPSHPEPLPSSPGQQPIEYEQKWREGVLRRCVLPKKLRAKDGTSVAPVFLGAVLKCIDSYAWGGGECFLSLETIMRDAKCGRMTVVRSVEILERLEVLAHEPKQVAKGCREKVNHYRIVWSKLEKFCPDCERDGVPPARDGVPPARDGVPPARDGVPSAVREPPETLLTSSNQATSFAPSEWQQAEAELFAFGSTAGWRLVDLAEEQRVAAPAFLELVRAAIATATLNRSKFSEPPAALYRFLETALKSPKLEGRWAAEGIVSIDDAKKRDDERRRLTVAAVAAEQRRIAEKEAAARELADLEAECAAELDAMPPVNLLAFARQVFAGEEGEFILSRLRRHGELSPYIRRELLKSLSARRGASTPAEPVEPIANDRENEADKIPQPHQTSLAAADRRRRSLFVRTAPADRRFDRR